MNSPTQGRVRIRVLMSQQQRGGDRSSLSPEHEVAVNRGACVQACCPAAMGNAIAMLFTLASSSPPLSKANPRAEKSTPGFVRSPQGRFK